MMYRPPASTPLPEEGDLSSVPFGELLFRAARERKTGTLLVTDGNISKTFLFQDGLVVAGRSNQPGESLAKLTVVRGKATRETVEGLGVPLLNDEAVARALLQAGLSTEDLEEMLRFQLLFRLADTFARPGLGFGWAPPEAVSSPTPVNAYQIFTEGVAKRMPRELLDVQFADIADLRPHVTAGQTVFPLDPGALPMRAAQLFRRVDGRSSFRELVEGIRRTSPPEQIADNVYRTWVYLVAFLDAGYIEIGEGTAAAVPPQRRPAPTPASAPPQARPPAPAGPPASAAPQAPPAADAATETVMVVTEAGGGAVAYHEIDDPSLTARFADMQKLNFFEVLGVPEDANDGAVKKAYFKLAKEFHPDKLYNHQERTVKKYADRAFAIVNKAYEQLKSPQGRKEYLVKAKELAQGLDLDKEAMNMLKSEVEFQKGVACLRKKDFVNAVQFFQAALDLNPREAEHHAYTGWSEFQLTFPANEAAWRDAIAKIERAVEIDPKSPESAFFLGQAYKVSGNAEKALEMFAKVLRLRPHHVEAQRELRLIEQRAQAAAAAPKDKKGKLFK